MTESLFARDILTEAFDTHEAAVGERPRKLFICTTPRTAGHTFCHALRGRGWGVPTEYFHPDMALPLQRLWLASPPADWAVARGRADEYGQLLLTRRSPNRVFGAKIFPADVPYAQAAVGLDTQHSSIWSAMI
jgi:LPS sulfotransferase NodH